MSVFQRLTHIGICVSDLARSRRFYCEALGFAFEHELAIAGEPTDTLLRLRGSDLRAIYLTRDGVRIQGRPGERVEIFDVAGRRVARLDLPADGVTTWNDPGVAPGVFLARAGGRATRLVRLP